MLEDKDKIFQLTKVLRLKEQDSIILFDWQQLIDHVYVIDQVTKKKITLNKKEVITKNSEQERSISLVQALPNKLEKLEYIIQKWTEIWMSKFIIYRSKRSQKNILTDKKILRLKKIIIEATEQCGGNIIPKLEIMNVVTADLLSLNGSNVCCHTKNETSITLAECITHIEPDEMWDINIFVWPEWWFSEREVEDFTTHDFLKIHLGKRILRTETAWICVAFALSQFIR